MLAYYICRKICSQLVTIHRQSTIQTPKNVNMLFKAKKYASLDLVNSYSVSPTTITCLYKAMWKFYVLKMT